MKTIIKKYLAGNGTDAERHQLLDWLRKENHRTEFQQVKSEWESEQIQEEMPDGSRGSWSSFQNHLLLDTEKKLNRSVRYLQFYKYAAILVVAIFIGSLGWQLIGGDLNLQYSIVKADAGQIANVELPDHTEIWLNSGSYIKYSNEFGKSNRDIELVGEAFFSVTKNPQLPLVVSGSPIKVKVLGTRFNVSAYPDDQNFNVTLERGKVELFSDQYKDFRKALTPDHRATFNKATRQFSIKKVNVDLDTSWKDGIINIYDLPLEEVIVKLSKRYNQKFVVDDQLKQTRYTYTIKNESLADVLKLMATITPIKVIQDGDVIRIKYNRQKSD